MLPLTVNSMALLAFPPLASPKVAPWLPWPDLLAASHSDHLVDLPRE